MSRSLALVPCGAFLILSGLSLGIVLLSIVPTNPVLWWINIELFSKLRFTYYFLEEAAGGSTVLLLFVLTLLAAIAGWAAYKGIRPILFVLQHAAVLLVGISLIPIGGTMAMSIFDAPVAPVVLNAYAMKEVAWTCGLFVLCAASCAESHWFYVRRYLLEIGGLERLGGAGDTEIAAAR